MKGKLMRVLRWILIVGVVCFLAAQFYRPARTNPASDPSQAIESHLPVTPEVTATFDRSCNDCHSNKTRWPWYSNVAPVSWFVIDHVDDGRRHLNFSDWGRYNAREVDNLLQRICGEVKAGGMPLSSYTPMHPGSKISSEDVKTLCDWTTTEQARIAAH
jgi:hypothetical protein